RRRAGRPAAGRWQPPPEDQTDRRPGQELRGDHEGRQDPQELDSLKNTEPLYGLTSRRFHKCGLVMEILGFQETWEIWFNGACRSPLVSGIDPLAQGSCLMSRRAPLIRLSREEKQKLQKIANAHSSPQAQAFRSRIILRCGQGDRPTNEEVAQEFDCDPG